jgi:hypothetical protein
LGFGSNTRELTERSGFVCGDAGTGAIRRGSSFDARISPTGASQEETMTQDTQAPQPQPEPRNDAMLAAQTDDRTLDGQYDDDRTAGFQTDEVEATRAREQGLGMGERELQAQRDPGVEMTSEDDEDEDLDDVEELDGVDRNVAVQGDDAHAARN